MDATSQLKEMLNLSNFGVNVLTNGLEMASNNLMHSLPNNCTLRVDSSSTKSLFNVFASKAAIEGRESTNSYFTKIERLVEYNWDLLENINLIAVNNRKSLIAYVLNQTNRGHRSFSSPKNANLSPETRSQMIRVMNYENISIRCLDKGVFYSQIADLAFTVNSVSSNSLDIMKLAVADREGNVYIYNIKEENGGLSIERILEIKNNGREHNYVKLSWCPYIPNDDDESEMEGDMGLKLALSCDTTVELFAIDVLQELYKEAATVDVSKLKISLNCYQIIENAHKMPIISLSIAQDVTAICTAGLDDNIKFYKISLNSPNLPKMLKEWIPNYLEPDDHITCFYFLDDFDFLLSNSEQTFWGHALFGTKNGVLSIIDLKNWRSRQSIKLICNELSKSDNGFNYKIDLTSHFVVAVRDNAAFVLHIKFPHDKEEQFDDCDDKTNCDDAYDNSHPYINKVSRFQIYNAPLLSFAVKKSINGNILIFWITRKTLEVCYIDLGLINVDEFYGSPFEMSVPNMIDMKESNSIVDSIFSSDKTVTATNNENNIDLINGTDSNDFNCFDSIITPTKLITEPQINSMPPPPPAVNTLPAFNMPLNLTPPFANETQSFPRIAQPLRVESPASEEIQQILSPSLSHQLKTLLSVGPNNPQSKIEDTEFIKSRPENVSLGDATSEAIAFPTKLPNILKDLVREEQLFQLKDEMRKEIQDSEMRIIQSLDKVDNKINAKLININEQVINNSKIQTTKLENDIKEMKKELKNACKIRNEEFNKIVEKLVNKVMHEMNVIVQKGFQELVQQLNKEVKQVTAEFEKSGIALQSKLMASQQKAEKTHFQPLIIPQQSTPASHQPNYNPSPTLNTPVIQSRKTPQNVVNVTHSVPTTPLPFSMPRNSYQTDTFQPSYSWQQIQQQQQQMQQKQQEQQQQQQQQQQQIQQKQQQQQEQHQKLIAAQQLKQKQQALKNEIITKVSTGQIEDAIIKALNLKDPDLVTQICELYQSNPSALINAVKSDQICLITLLQQLIFNFTVEEKWKTGYIEQIMTNLDLEHDIITKILPQLAPKLVQLLNEIANTGGPYSEKAKLLAFTFKHLRV